VFENQYCLKSDAGGQVLLILAKRNLFLAIFSSAAAFLFTFSAVGKSKIRLIRHQNKICINLKISK